MTNVIRGLMGAGVLVVAGAFATSAEAATISLSGVCAQQAEGSSGLGNCTKTASYNDVTNLLTITLTNTSPAANGGYITADAFNLPELDSEILVTSFLSTNTNFTFDQTGDFSVAPNGFRGVLISTGGGFTGGGPAAGGIGTNQSATFTLTLASDLTAPQFGAFFLSEQIRFRGFEDGGSDKTGITIVPGPGGDDPDVTVPEPASVLLLGMGLAAVMRSRMRRSPQA